MTRFFGFGRETFSIPVCKDTSDMKALLGVPGLFQGAVSRKDSNWQPRDAYAGFRPFRSS